MNSNKFWDVDDVYLLKDLLRDKNVSESMLGSVFRNPRDQGQVAWRGAQAVEGLHRLLGLQRAHQDGHVRCRPL